MIAPPLLELRQYLLHPGRRDELVDLFDAEFVETQEDVGITVVGQYCDLDRPDHFVWMRAFPDPEARTASLTAFYDGPVWAAHRDRANATMVDSDDVLLLRPYEPGAALDLPDCRADTPRESITIVVFPIADDGALAAFVEAITDGLSAGGRTLGVYVTDPSDNGFPRLPVRSDRVAVWIGRPGSRGTAPQQCQVLRLAPTSRSLLR